MTYPQDRNASYPIRPLSGGYNDALSPILIGDGQTPECENIEFDRDSLAPTGGVIKFNSQPGRKAAIRTRVEDGKSLSVASGISVPLRGYALFPYSQDIDQLGGDFATGGEDFLGGTQETFHARRGKSFEVNVTFQVPVDQKLFSQEATDNYPTQDPNFGIGSNYSEWQMDQSFEDTFIVLQKGGDRLTPMSWAIGVTYVSSAYEDLTGQSDKELASRYRLVFMWLDAAGWGEGSPTQMRYSLSNGVDVATAGPYSTAAYRAILTDCAVEPGRSYSVAVQLQLDSGLPGTGATPLTSWNDDGTFKIVVSTDAGPVSTYSYDQSTTTASGMYVWKGPTDSLDYITKYGIRYSGRDEMFAGLGFRCVPWKETGFIPYGVDASAMEKGGHQFLDWSQVDLGALGHDLECNHTGTNAYVEVNFDYLSGVIGTQSSMGFPPMGPLAYDVAAQVGVWAGQGFSGTTYNPEALRGYRIQIGDGSGSGGSPRAGQGSLFSIESFEVNGSSHRLNIAKPNGNYADFNDTEFVLHAFRWNQRELLISDVRIYSTPRDYSNPAVAFSLITEPHETAALEPDAEALLARWALDDGGGATLEEEVGSRDGFLAPFGLGQSETGTRGGKRIFLSGEGECLQLDLSNNPAFSREFQAMLKGNSGGFAVEMSFQETGASYAVSENVTVNTETEFRARFVPNMISWSVKNPELSGATTDPKPLLVFGHQNYYLNTLSGGPGSALPFRRPQGFSLSIHESSDEAGDDSSATLNTRAWKGANTTNWDLSAPWVGNTVTVQVGVEPTANDDEFRVYIAATPKALLNPKTSDPAGAEFAYFNTVTIERKDLLRSVITIGGLHDTGDAGVYEANWRGILDEVRVFATAAPGNLPFQSSQPILDGNGKVLGTDSYPDRQLTRDDILRPVGPGLSTCDLVELSPTVSAPTGGSFYTDGVVPSLNGIDQSYLVVNDDFDEVRRVETVPDRYQEFYHIASVASSGSTFTLTTNYTGSTRDRAPAKSMRIVGYTALTDDLYGKEQLTIGSTDAFVAGTSRSASAILTGDYFGNAAPLGENWALRIFSPGANPLPGWVESPKPPRKNPILGMESINDLVFAGAGTCLYRADDRWNLADEIDEGRTSLRFLVDRPEATGSPVPLAGDGVRLSLPASDKFQINDTNMGVSTDERSRVWDFRVRQESLAGTQTLVWCGAEEGNVGRAPTNTAGDNRLNHWIRISNGQPEFLIGNTGTTVPNGGFYAASGAITLQAGREYHIRWQVDVSSGWLLKPRLKVNGQEVSVSVNGVTTPGSGDQWVQTNVMSAAGDTPVLLMGHARGHRFSKPTLLSFTSGSIRGIHFKPQLNQGRMYALDGEISEFHSWYGSVADMIPSPDFSPDTPFFPSNHTDVLHWTMQEGIGHKLVDSGPNGYTGTIQARPLIPLICDVGKIGPTGQWSMVSYGDRMIAANGNRPVVWRATHSARGLGVRPPTVKPEFEIKRFPLWTPNEFTASATSGNDPMSVAAAGASEQKNHYQTRGNNYLRQANHSEMDFEQDDYFVFKTYIKPTQISGRRVIYDERISLTSGNKTIEIVDGKIRLGWYDTYLKQQQYIETSKPVLRTGLWHYLYVRLKWPPQDVDRGNWLDSFYGAGNYREADVNTVSGTFTVGETISWTGGTGIFQSQSSDNSYITYTQASGAELTSGLTVTGGTSAETAVAAANAAEPSNCSLVVRYFADSSTTVLDDEYAFMREPPVGTRAAISFTSVDGVNGEPATGRVSLPAMQVTLSGSTVTTVADTGYFHGDMIGMRFMFEDGPNAGTVFFILTTPAANQATIATFDNSAPAADGATRNCGVFSSVKLMKSANFDLSKQPEAASNKINTFGSPLQVSTIGGVAPFAGEFGSYGFVCTSTENFFEAASTADKIETGTDDFTDYLYGSVVPGDLFYSKSAGETFTVVQSSQPANNKEVALDTESSDNAEPPVWQQVQSTTLLSGSRAPTRPLV